MAGRKRKSGERFPSGGLRPVASSPDRGPAERLVRAATLMGEEGIGVDASNPMAVLAALGHITNEQAQAGEDFARAHRALYGRPWPPCGERDGKRHVAMDERAMEAAQDLEDKVKRGQAAIDRAGGNAVTIIRSVCCGMIMPEWVKTRTVATVIGGKVAFRAKDRGMIRAMMVELPAMRAALDHLRKAGFGMAAQRRAA